MISRLDALKARMAAMPPHKWRDAAMKMYAQSVTAANAGDFLLGMIDDNEHLEIELAHAREDIERLVAVVEAARSIITLSQIQLSFTPRARQFRNALAYWLEEEQK